MDSKGVQLERRCGGGVEEAEGGALAACGSKPVVLHQSRVEDEDIHCV